MPVKEHIFPTDKFLPRKRKEKLLKQKGRVIWMTGLSGSGKTTIAIALEKALAKKGIITHVLDGDNVRMGINNNLGFSETDRTENIRRVAEVAKILVNSGIVTLCCFVSPTRKIRALARTIIGKSDFFEVYVNTPLEICEARDVKGLYARARKGEIKDFTGISAAFEPPLNAQIEVRTNELSVDQSVAKILKKLK